MLRLKNWMINPLRVLQSHPWPQTTAVAPRLDDKQIVEEEQTPYYHRRLFYPAHLGEVLNGRYQIAAKLGCGTSSTVWLARDLSRWKWSPEHYCTIKINAQEIINTNNKTAENELGISQIITKANLQHEGRYFVRTLLDSFLLKGSPSDHICLVFEPLREPLWLLQKRFNGKTIPSALLKIMIQMLLHGLNYLHQFRPKDSLTLLPDLNPSNIMVRLEEKSMLEKVANEEFTNPLPQKISDDRIIYLSRNDFGPPSEGKFAGIISLIDFGLSTHGDGPHYGCIQIEPYRAPEVILDAGYSYSADIWSLGVMLWDLLENDKSLFEAIDQSKNGEKRKKRRERDLGRKGESWPTNFFPGRVC